jgi:hypothetical protein
MTLPKIASGMLRGLYNYAHPALDLSDENLAILSKIDHPSI